MATKMKVKKGDLVQILAGKDRGKQGRVLEARPKERRVVVENLNTVKRHTRPRPLRDASRMGGTQMAPGGIIDMPAAVLEDMETSQVSIFAVQVQQNELHSRMQMTDVVNRRRMRHAHMVNIDKQIMAQAPVIPWFWDKQANIESKGVKGVIAKWNASWDFSYTSVK